MSTQHSGRDVSTRDQLRRFLAVPDLLDRNALRDAIERDIHEAQATRGTPRSLKFFAHLLALKRDPRDVPLLWRAKSVHADAMAAIDVQLLVACGVEPAKEALAQAGEEEGLRYLERSEKSGDFDDLEEKIAAHRFFLQDDLDEEWD
jgi:hypothetical protein